MNLEIDRQSDSHKYAKVLFDFCTTFEQEWTKGHIRTWSPPHSGNVVLNLTQLLNEVQIALESLELRVYPEIRLKKET